MGKERKRGKYHFRRREVEAGGEEDIKVLEEEQYRNLRRREEGRRREAIDRETMKNSFEKEKSQIGLLGAIVHKLETLDLKWNLTG